MEENNFYWFAAKTKPRQEKFIKGQLTELGVTNFIPLRTELRQWKYRKKKVIVPVIPHLVFLRTDYDTCFRLLNENKINIWYIKDFITKRNLIVPDKQMEDFMLLINAKEGNVRVINPDLAKGDKVIVKEGPFKGIEGELIRVEDKSRVVVNLQGIIAVSVDIEGVFLEKIE
jgi:transcription antitermination factor NusG